MKSFWLKLEIIHCQQIPGFIKEPYMIINSVYVARSKQLFIIYFYVPDTEHNELLLASIKPLSDQVAVFVQ